MESVRTIRVSHGELVVQMDSFPTRWEKFQSEYEKLCRFVSFKVGRNPGGQLFMKQIYRKIGRLFDDCFGAGSAVAVFSSVLISLEQLAEFCEKFNHYTHSGWRKSDLNIFTGGATEPRR